MKYEYAVFIGRFSPLHLGHLDIINEALNQADKVVVVIGSHNKARNVKNPWSSEERAQMITNSLEPADAARMKFVFMRDYLYNDAIWISDLQNKICEATEDADDSKIALIGFKSDATSYYLDLFPHWNYVSCPTRYNFHATEIRDMYFTLDAGYKKYVPAKVGEYLETFGKSSFFKDLKEEYEFVRNYKELWRGAPFAPTFVTVDSIVLKSGHVLLVRRKGNPGRGLIALPGGFVNQDERIADAALRELKEETAIKLSKEELRKAVVDEKVFDHPARSLRGRTISHAYLINLGSGPLDKVKGSDDADKAFWLPLNEALSRESEFFEDHYHIINYFVKRV